MLKITMQKKPKVVAAKFHEVFDTRFQLAIIGGLLALIVARLIGSL